MSIKKYFPLLILFISSQSFAFTLITNFSGHFKDRKVGVYVPDTSDCSSLGIDNQELVEIIEEAVETYWNQVPSSYLILKSRGILEGAPAEYASGELCNYYSSTQMGIVGAQFHNEFGEPNEPSLEAVTATCGAGAIPQHRNIYVACNTLQSNFENISGVYNPGILANTQISLIEGSYIAGATIVINAVNSSSAFASLSRSKKIATIAHELGHAIGLGHSKEIAALMYFALPPERVSLGQDDIEGVTYLYARKYDSCGLTGTLSFGDFWFSSLGLGASSGALALAIILLLMKLWAKSYRKLRPRLEHSDS